jgi:monovalent cation:H+ antiporter, CPA1 family
VTVGLILGNFGSRVGMNPRTRLLVSEFWEFLAFFVNSIVFLLIGDRIKISSLSDNMDLILVAIASVILTRMLAIYGLASLSNWIANTKINFREQTVLWWAGLRGSVSIALALSVPATLLEKQEIIETVFGVVLFTLLFQGLTTKWLLEKLDLIGDRPLRQKYSEMLARRVALKRVLDYLAKLDNSPGVDPALYHQEKELIQGQLDAVEKNIEKLQIEYAQLRSLDMEQLREQLLEIEADTYAEFIRAGRLNNDLPPLLQEIWAKAQES